MVNASRERASLERQKAYYDFFAAMSPAERDRRFHDRFDQMDTNHDGGIDPAERAAWHDKQRAYYDRPNYRHNVGDRRSRPAPVSGRFPNRNFAADLLY
jgi:hypothetical protein